MKDLIIANFDERSDISDATSTTQSSSADGREYDPDLLEEKFRVDRKKLEQMLQGLNGNSESAEQFFQRVMDETKTAITWPSKLKIGAKSKKDPHIKVSGSVVAIREARAQIKAVLDTKTSRVTLKVDVSYTDHSHIIGRGGNNIQRVMTETDCHIHFPDSNRNNATEKSNQVSIAGQPEGVELARTRIRELLPLVFMFVTPVTGVPQPMPDRSSLFIQGLQVDYDIQIHFKQQMKHSGTSVIVRGSEFWAQKVMAGTKVLIRHLNGNAEMFVPIKMTIEISPQHLAKVRESCEALLIAQRTGTAIHFPDANILGPSIARSTVEITGELEGVYYARKMLMECLPLVLLFDLKEEDNVTQDHLQSIMSHFNVHITIKPKQRLPCVGVVVRGTEKEAANLYKVRNLMLGVPNSVAALPAAPRMFGHGPPPQSSLPMNYQSVRNGVSAFNQDSRQFNINLPPVRPNMSHNVGAQSTAIRSTGGWNTSLSTAANYPLSFLHMPSNNSELCAALSRFGHLSAGLDSAGCSATSSTGSCHSSPSESPRQGSPVGLSSVTGSLDLLPRNDSGVKQFSKAEALNVLASLVGLSINSTQDSAKLSSVPVSKIASPVCIDPRTSQGGNGQLQKPPGFEQVQPSITSQLQYDFPEDYEQKKVQALEARRLHLEEPQIRVPTSSWSGYGFSQSMPEKVLREKLAQCNISKIQPDKTQTGERWKEIDLGSSNYMDVRTQSMKESLVVSKCQTLAELLNNLNLSKYIDTFFHQEIDLAMFVTLTDQELKDLGITTFGARRKMLSAIFDLRQHQSAFFVAPGAERKMSSNLRRSSGASDCTDQSPPW